MSEYKQAVLFLPALAFIGSILQVFLAELDTTYAGISLGCLILFFFYQSRDVNVDYLSGLLNRRGLDIKLQEMVKNAATSGRDFTAIMVDVDNTAVYDLSGRMVHQGKNAPRRLSKGVYILNGKKKTVK